MDLRPQHTGKLDGFFRWPHEAKTAQVFRELGVPMRSRPDAPGKEALFWGRKPYAKVGELKTLRASSQSAIKDRIRKAKRQGAETLGLDLTNTRLGPNDVRKVLAQRIRNGREVTPNILVPYKDAAGRKQLASWYPKQLQAMGKAFRKQPKFVTRGLETRGKSAQQRIAKQKAQIRRQFDSQIRKSSQMKQQIRANNRVAKQNLARKGVPQHRGNRTGRPTRQVANQRQQTQRAKQPTKAVSKSNTSTRANVAKQAVAQRTVSRPRSNRAAQPVSQNVQQKAISKSVAQRAPVKRSTAVKKAPAKAASRAMKQQARQQRVAMKHGASVKGKVGKQIQNAKIGAARRAPVARRVVGGKQPMTRTTGRGTAKTARAPGAAMGAKRAMPVRATSKATTRGASRIGAMTRVPVARTNIAGRANVGRANVGRANISRASSPSRSATPPARGR